MCRRIIQILFSMFACLPFSQCDNRLWILIDNVRVFECEGITNEATIDPKNIKILDADNNAVNLIEAPGTYKISFDNIQVQKALPNLNGFMRITMQVPFATGPLGVNWHYTYQAVPHKTLFDGSRCDNESGVVVDINDKSKEYCKYCDLCQTSRSVDQLLGKSENLGHKYLPSVNSEREPGFDKICRQINASTYSMYRTVNLPDKDELANEANANFKGIDEELKQRLRVGKGKLHVSLILQTNTERSVERNDWYDRTDGCQCCAKDENGVNACQRGLLNDLISRVSNGAVDGIRNRCYGCNNIFVQDCLRGQTEKVACFTVEFNFRVTDKIAEVEQFKLTAKKDLSPLTKVASTSVRESLKNVEQQGDEQQNQRALKRDNVEKCINSINSSTFANYCRKNWDPSFCCDLPFCKGTCE